jgi:hypothetical protein
MKRERATANTWKIKPMPAANKELPVSGSYTAKEYERLSFGFIPQDQDDKWFIYLEGEWLHVHRSWTGSCIFQLHIAWADDHYEAVRAIANRDPEQYRSSSDEQDVKLLSHLVDELLLGRFSILPAPGGLSPEDQQRHQEHVMGRPRGGGLRLDVRNGQTR